MRIDAHQHFWSYSNDAADYGWIGSNMDVLRRDYGPDDLGPLLSELGFSGSVAVQARESEAENDALLALADAHPTILAVVGWLDLCAENAEARIAHFAQHDRFKGVRMLIHDHPDPDFASSQPHVRGVAMLHEHGLTYDLLLRPAHIPAAVALVDAIPEGRFVVDHIAKPNIAGGWDEQWAKHIASIAARPNVWCKLSGMVTESNWARWHDAPYDRYLDHVLNCFGPDRLMIGSDWPVALCAADYRAAMSVVIEWTQKLSPDEQTAILGGNCHSFYAIGQS